jgi:transposase
VPPPPQAQPSKKEKFMLAAALSTTSQRNRRMKDLNGKFQGDDDFSFFALATPLFEVRNARRTSPSTVYTSSRP